MSQELKKITIDLPNIGAFILRYPNVLDTINIGKLRSKYFSDLKYVYDEETGLSTPQGIDPITYGMATTICELIVVTEEKPESFDFEACDDIEVLSELYDRYNAWRSSFRGQETASEPLARSGDSAD